ncbi:MAG TPA: molybdopterin oxidoreductase, partial [Coriobacteriia bacterium]|nr:molybdopterin oxidoreductase [Coriobacteriia bacterium]
GGLAMGPGLPFDYSASTAEFRLEKLYNDSGMQQGRHDLKDFPVWAHYFKMIQTAHLPELVEQGKIKAGILLGLNTMMWPQTPMYQEAVKNLEFSVVIDYYLRPWNEDLIDMILPAAMCYERMAPFAVFGRKIFLREPVVKPLGQAREDWQILLEIGCALGFADQCYNGSVEAALEDMLAKTDLGITLADLRANPEGYEVPGGSKDSKKYETGGLRKDKQPGFNTPTGKIEFVSEILKQYNFEGLPVYEEPVHSPISTPEEAKEYPLVLNSGSRVPFYTHSKLRELPWLNQFMPEPVVRLHPKDAETRGIFSNDEVRLFNQNGEITVKAEVTNLVLPGVIDVFHGWHRADINLLTTRDFDPITGFPPFRSGLCQVELSGKGRLVSTKTKE